MSIDNIRCLFELLIIPLLAWLWTIYARDRKTPAAGGSEVDAEVNTPKLDSDRFPPKALPESDPKIEQLASAGDLNGLLTVLHAESDAVLRLDAADALTRMGNEEGLDYLIGLLESQDEDEQGAAREILEDLNDPRANAALQSHRSNHAAAQPLPASVERTQAEHSYTIDRQPPSGLATGRDAWASYFAQQAALGIDRAGSASQSVVAGQPAVGAVPNWQTRQPRWVKDFGPGALGAFLVTLGLLVFGYFGNIGFEPEDKLAILYAGLICSLPLSAVAGALSGAAVGLLAKRIVRALGSGDRVQLAATTMGSFVSGAVTGLLCYGGFLVAQAF